MRLDVTLSIQRLKRIDGSLRLQPQFVLKMKLFNAPFTRITNADPDMRRTSGHFETGCDRQSQLGKPQSQPLLRKINSR